MRRPPCDPVVGVFTVRQVNCWHSQGIDMTHAAGVLLDIPKGEEWDDLFRPMLADDQGGYWILPSAPLLQTPEQGRLRLNDGNVRQPPDLGFDLRTVASRRFAP